MPSKTLYPHQGEPVQLIVGCSHDYLVDWPTGSGKTLMIVATTAFLVPEGWKVIIASPQQHIEQAFTDRDYDAVTMPNGQTLPCSAELIRAARGESAGTIRSVLEYLNGPAAPGYALACTHAAMALIDKYKQPAEPPSVALPDDMSKCVLFVDEAHHASASALSQVVELWRRKGGRVLFYTATAFRNDGDPVCLGKHPVTDEEMRVHRRTLAQHMEEGFAPAACVIKMTAIHVDEISAQEFAGLTVPKLAIQNKIIDAMLAEWLEDGRPKLIVRVPIMMGTDVSGTAVVSKTTAMVDRVVAAFQALGARVLDVSGQDAEDKVRFLTKLPTERGLTRYDESVVDVVVGVQRVNEGFDWPLASTVYVVGLPTSLVQISQLHGRTTRLKLLIGYPVIEAGRSKTVLFVPRSSDPTDELLKHHKTKTVLMCAHLQNATSAPEWATVKAIASGIVEKMSDRIAPTTSQIATSYPDIDPVFRAEALAVFSAIRQDLITTKSAASDVVVLERAYSHLPQIPRSVLRQLMVEFIVTSTGQNNAKGREKVRQALLTEIAENLKKGDKLKDAIRTAFEHVVVALDSIAVITDQKLGYLHEQVVTLSGVGIKEIGFRLAAARPLTPEWLASVLAEYYERTKQLSNGVGIFPTAKTTAPVPGWADESWAEINKAIAGKKRNWELISIPTLDAFVKRYAARGTVGTLLERFRKDGRLLPAENALLDSLIAQRVQINNEVMAFGHTPVPAPGGWPAPNWWVLTEWAKTQWGKPLAEVYAAVLLTNLRLWLKANGGYKVSLDAVTAASKRAEVYADAQLELVSRYDSYVDASGVVFKKNKEFAAWVPSPKSTAPQLTRNDGAKPFKRSDAGYWEACIGAQPYLTPSDNPAAGSTPNVGVESSFPLDWVTSVNGVRVPHDWSFVKDFAAVTLANTSEAA